MGICIVKQWKERLGEQYMNTSQAEGIDQLQSWVNESKRIVFFGGAGVSTESGIPDFRSVDGLYHQNMIIHRKPFSAIRFYAKYKSVL